MKKYKVLFCDMDGTLIETASGETFPKGIWDMKFKFDVLDAIKNLNPEEIFIVTNQGGIEKGLFPESFIYVKCEYVSYSITSYGNLYGVIYNVDTVTKKGRIDCGTNEELFLAIAALRDDSNYMQWFITDSILSVSYDDSIGNDHYFTEPKGIMFFWDENWDNATIISGRYHKATVDELIEHFKTKEEQ